MFPDFEIARSFGCGHTKTAGRLFHPIISKRQHRICPILSPSCLMSQIDKSCIILVRLLDPELGNVCTRFLDMPVINIGNAQNIFRALRESLAKFGLDFSKAVSFMSDTASVMKGCRSGVQKLIKNEMPHLHVLGVCHIANLSIEAGVKTLPVDIDQLFVDM